ncbi:hypothetical protein GIB67_002347 [Kingdonia uniflora]|uniref:Uncharacterized protein n=1 Tax=Kingdonia uniflora TaxID=39325 RepID=A0A7J7LRP2_9MAGN|nr:hypothetical protein GIB67_002347 [Kingdonia uniflora]
MPQEKNNLGTLQRFLLMLKSANHQPTRSGIGKAHANDSAHKVSESLPTRERRRSRVRAPTKRSHKPQNVWQAVVPQSNVATPSGQGINANTTEETTEDGVLKSPVPTDTNQPAPSTIPEPTTEKAQVDHEEVRGLPGVDVITEEVEEDSGMNEGNHTDLSNNFTSPSLPTNDEIAHETPPSMSLADEETILVSQSQEFTPDFQEGGAPIFLLTSQVGGLGLTLTKEDRVIAVDPAWNPRYTSLNIGVVTI